jgi:hypothetical protein
MENMKKGTFELKELSEWQVIPTEAVNEMAKKVDLDEVSVDAMARFSIIKEKEFGKPYFCVYNGVLRQFKVKRQFVLPFTRIYKYRDLSGDEHSCHSAILLSVAGVGDMWVNGASMCYVYGRIPFSVFLTVEDYKERKPYVLEYAELGAKDITETYSKVWSFTKTYATYRTRLYEWDGTKAVSVKGRKGVVLGFTWDGTRIDIGMSPTAAPYYLTTEDCERDNTVKVEYFADEKPADEGDDDVYELIFGVTFKFSEKDVEKILSAVRKFAK